MASVVVGCFAAAPGQAIGARELKQDARRDMLKQEQALKRGSALKPVTVCTSGTDVITHNETWSAREASAYLIGCRLEVGKGATLTILKETVVKFGLGGQPGGFYVAPGGRLSAEGCPQPPRIPHHPWHRVPCPKQRIVFTTIYDNSVGGHTAPAGQAGSSWGYSNLIEMDGRSSVYVDYADVRHATNSVVDGDPLVISGCAASGDESLTFTSTITSSPVSLGQCDGTTGASHYDVSGDTFGLAAGTTGLHLWGKPTDTAVVSGDRFDYLGSTPTDAIMTDSLPVQGFSLAGRTSSTFDSQAPVAVQLNNGSVPAGKSWAFASPDGVPLEGQIAVAGKTLISPSARLSNTRLTLEPTGHLAVSGSPSHPARFENGSWIVLTGAGALAITHAVFSANPAPVVWEQDCLAKGGESVHITDSTFAAPVQIGTCDSAGGDSLTVEQNHFVAPDSQTGLTVNVPELNFSPPGHPGQLTLAGNRFAPAQAKLTQDGPPEVSIYGWPVQGIALTGTSANRFLGTGNGRVLALTAASLPLGQTWTVDPASGAVIDALTEYVFGNPGLAVQGKLVLDPGTIVKVGQGAGQSGGYGVGYGVGLGNIGTLVAHGTPADPIIFTSMNDDSVGGESTGVPTTPSQKDYTWAVAASEGSTVDVSNAVFRNGLFAFEMDCSLAAEPGGRFDLTDSVIDDEIELGYCNRATPSYRPVLERNSFPFNGSPSPSGFQPAVVLYNSDPSGIDLSGPNANDFDQATNAGRVVALAGGEIPSGETWSVSGTSGAVLAAWPDTDYLAPPGLTVAGALSLSNNMIVKSGISQPTVEVTKTGSLATSGSPAAVFTSLTDDSIGGYSNGGTKATHGTTGAYGIAIQFDHLESATSISDLIFKYASDALNYEFMGSGGNALLPIVAHVVHSDFVFNQAAMVVEETSGSDYGSIGEAACFPPWISGVAANNDWFGPGGGAAPDIDLASVFGAVPTGIPYEGSAYNYSQVGTMIDEEHLNFGKPNTVPWAIYSCAKVPLPIPLTGVSVLGTPKAPYYPTEEK